MQCYGAEKRKHHAKNKINRVEKKEKDFKDSGKKPKKTNKQKDTRTTAKILINDVAKSGLVVSKKQSALHSNGL